jgi:hypothetical protein
MLWRIALTNWRRKIILLACAAVLAMSAYSALRPARTPDESFLRGAETGAAVRNILFRACADCHSEATEVPWYGTLPWISRLIDEDVRRGREQLNFSRWSEYSRLRQQRALTGIANQVKDGIMPLPEYTNLHPSARLSDSDVNAVFEWAQKERLRLIMETTR